MFDKGLRIAVALSIATLFGCNIQIFSPEGGQVSTESGAYSCASGEQCIVEVVDTSFDETFIANPEQGYVFSGWKKANGYICGGTDTGCTVQTGLFEGNALLMSFLNGANADTVVYLEPEFELKPVRPTVESVGSYSTRAAVADTGVGNVDKLATFYPIDLNDDTYLDIVVIGGIFPPLPREGAIPGLILLNDREGSFTIAPGDRPAIEWGGQVIPGDYDGDGRIDIFIADSGWDAEPFPGFRNQLLLNTAAGFVDASDNLPGLEDYSHSAGAGDIDGDGDLDLIVVNSAFGDDPERPYALINDGHANFTLERSILPSFWMGGYVNEPEGYEQFAEGFDPVIFTTFAGALSDLDGDGYAELILGQNGFYNSAPSRIHWNQGGYFTDEHVTFLPNLNEAFGGSIAQTANIEIGDVNNDQRPDILIIAYRTDFSGSALQLLVNEGNRQFSDDSDARMGPLRASELGLPQYLFRDFNHDGTTDIVAHDTPLFGESDSVLVWLNNGSGYFAPIRAFEFIDAKTDDTYFGDDSLGQVPLPHPTGNAIASFQRAFPDPNNPGIPAYLINLLVEDEPIVLKLGD